MHKWLISWCGLALIVFVACGTKEELTRGNSIVVTKEIDLYFASLDGYKVIDPAAHSLVTSGALWLAPKGVEISESYISVEDREVEWQVGNTEYSAQGIRITARARLTADDSISPGWKSVYLQLPGLDALDHVLATVATAPDAKSDQNGYLIHTFYINNNSTEKYVRLGVRNIIAVIAIIIGFALLGFITKLRESS